MAPLVFACALVGGWACQDSDAASCVWKVTSPSGNTLFLGGSVHALRSRDYPLPVSYTRAFDASSRLVFESDSKTLEAAGKGLVKAGQYPKGDSLKHHVDPRTYAYLRHYFALHNVPEQKFNTYRPWFINLMLEAPAPENYHLGVEEFLKKRAVAAHKPIAGLETVEEGISPVAGMSERESEALLLIHFIHLGEGQTAGPDVLDLWRRGDADAIARDLHAAYEDVPAFSERLINARNRNWIPKIEQFIKSGQTYFVVAGAGHMGGPQGVVALLRARGYKVEQL